LTLIDTMCILSYNASYLYKIIKVN
jgi:hypothetical protein